jgi:hypothetical protein
MIATMQPAPDPTATPGGPPPASPAPRRRRVTLAAAVLAVAAATTLLVRNLLDDPPPGPATASPPAAAAQTPADLDRARLCLDKSTQPGEHPEQVRSIRLRHADRYGDVLVVETAEWERYCQFNPDGNYHGSFASGTVLFPPAYLPATDPSAPIKRLSSGGSQVQGRVVLFEDSGRITAAVKAVRMACPGTPAAPATIDGSMYYGRIQAPDDPAIKAEDACATEALDATGRVLGRAHW